MKAPTLAGVWGFPDSTLDETKDQNVDGSIHQSLERGVSYGIKTARMEICCTGVDWPALCHRLPVWEFALGKIVELRLSMEGLELQAPVSSGVSRALAFFLYALAIGMVIRLASPVLLALMQRWW